MSTSLSTEQYLKQRLYGLKIYEISDLTKHNDSFSQIIGGLASVDVKIENKNKDMILLCSLPPLLTTLRCNKEKVPASMRFPHERWLEVISWKPRAFVYHNFLVNSFAFF